MLLQGPCLTALGSSSLIRALGVVVEPRQDVARRGALQVLCLLLFDPLLALGL